MSEDKEINYPRDLKPSGLDHKTIAAALGSNVKPIPGRLSIHLNQPLLDEAARVAALEASNVAMNKMLRKVHGRLLLLAGFPESDRQALAHEISSLMSSLANANKLERQTDGK